MVAVATGVEHARHQSACYASEMSNCGNQFRSAEKKKPFSDRFDQSATVFPA